MFFNLSCENLCYVLTGNKCYCDITLKELKEEAKTNGFIYSAMFYFLFKEEYKRAKNLLENALLGKPVEKSNIPKIVLKRKLLNFPKVDIYFDDTKEKVLYWVGYVYAIILQKQGKEAFLNNFLSEDFEELYIRGLVKGIEAYKLEKQFLKKLKTLPGSGEELEQFREFINRIVWKLLYFRNEELLKELSRFILVWYLADLIEDKMLFREYYLKLPNPLLEEEIIIRALKLENDLKGREEFKNIFLAQLKEVGNVKDLKHGIEITLDEDFYKDLVENAIKFYRYSGKNRGILNLKRDLTIDKEVLDLYTTYKSWYGGLMFTLLELTYFQQFFKNAKGKYLLPIAKALTGYSILETGICSKVVENPLKELVNKFVLDSCK